MQALILVDLQNDFMPGGTLPVPGGNEVVPVANRVQQFFELIVATQDWHPPTHGSFAANHPGKQPGDVVELNGLRQMLWPVHCVQESAGAALVSTLHSTRITRVFRKGTDPLADSYSGFFDNGHNTSTGMGDYLRSRGVSKVFVLGVATDYCVKFTVLDALQLGLEASLIRDGSRGVDVVAGDVEQALSEMATAGATIIQSDQLRRHEP